MTICKQTKLIKIQTLSGSIAWVFEFMNQCFFFLSIIIINMYEYILFNLKRNDQNIQKYRYIKHTTYRLCIKRQNTG